MSKRTTMFRWVARAGSLGLALTVLPLATARAQAPQSTGTSYTVTDGTIFDRSAWVNGHAPTRGDLSEINHAGSRARTTKKPTTKTSNQNKNVWRGGMATRGGFRRGGMGMGMGLHGFGGVGLGHVARPRVPVYVPPVLPSTVAPAARR
jgi:hypothetical protein